MTLDDMEKTVATIRETARAAYNQSWCVDHTNAPGSYGLVPVAPCATHEFFITRDGLFRRLEDARWVSTATLMAPDMATALSQLIRQVAPWRCSYDPEDYAPSAANDNTAFCRACNLLYHQVAGNQGHRVIVNQTTQGSYITTRELWCHGRI